MPANKSSISNTDSLEKMGEFWDRHDFTEFDDPNLPDVDFSFSDELTNSIGPIELDTTGTS